MLPLPTYKPPQLLAHPTRKQNNTTDYEPRRTTPKLQQRLHLLQYIRDG